MKKMLLILFILILPTLSLLMRPGIYTMHDFHVFRIQQFDLCTKEGIFPCRWSPDMGLGFGEPLFNFYGQFTYWLSVIPRSIGFSILGSYKIVAGFSILGSVLTMYLLGSKIWGKNGALLSSLLYAYAPYRAVDLWVRGAIPESLGFVFFPLILLFLYEFNFVGLSLSVFLLIITHNLSVLIFAPFAAMWWIYWTIKNKKYHQIFPTLTAGCVALLLSAFYLLPVAIESPIVSVASTTESYYQFANHFVSLYQLFVTNFWGYGGSIWGPNDGMSFSVGQVHWLLAAIVGALALIKKKPTAIFLVALSVLAAFLTHGKSEFIWKHIPGLPYIQFPWRYLTMTTLFLSLSAGFLADLVKNRLLLIILINLIILVNFNYFRPDIWHFVNDAEHFSGDSWDQQRSASLSDFWPKNAPQPTNFSTPLPELVAQGAHFQRYRFTKPDSGEQLVFPTVYFPGWTGLLDGRQIEINPSEHDGLITTFIPQGVHDFELRFVDTWPRLLGNVISAGAFLGLFSFFCLRYAKR